MEVVNSAFTAVYWLADRHAHLDTSDYRYAVSLRGPGRRLLEAHANPDGIVSMDKAIEYDTRALPRNGSIHRVWMRCLTQRSSPGSCTRRISATPPSGAIDWDGAETFDYIGADLRSRLSQTRANLLTVERPRDDW